MDDRTPFYLISVIFLLITIILSLITTFSIKTNGNDFFPTGGIYNSKKIIDNTLVDKICWYFSQLTHHTLFFLFSYFLMALLNIKSTKFFKMIGPLALTISVLYFYFLYPKQKLKIHQLSFYNFFSHFMIIFLVFCEFMYIDTYEFHETTNCFVPIISSILCIYINYFLRGVWSYNLVKLDTFSGWKLVSETTLIMYTFSLLFYLLKNKFKFEHLKDSYYVISGLINLLFVLIFTSLN